MARPTQTELDAAFKAWLSAHDLVGDFSRAGRAGATLRLYWNRQWAPGFDPAIPDWFADFPGEESVSDGILSVVGFTPGEISAEKAKPKKLKGGG